VLKFGFRLPNNYHLVSVSIHNPRCAHSVSRPFRLWTWWTDRPTPYKKAVGHFFIILWHLNFSQYWHYDQSSGTWESAVWKMTQRFRKVSPKIWHMHMHVTLHF